MSFTIVKREILEFIAHYLNNIHTLLNFSDKVEEMLELMEELPIYSSFELLTPSQKIKIQEEIAYLIRKRNNEIKYKEKNTLGGRVKKAGSLNKKAKRQHLSNSDNRTVKQRITDYFKRLINSCTNLTELENIVDNIQHYFHECPDYQEFMNFDSEEKQEIYELVSDLIEKKRDSILFNQRERSNVSRERPPPRNILDDDDYYTLGFR